MPSGTARVLRRSPRVAAQNPRLVTNAARAAIQLRVALEEDNIFSTNKQAIAQQMHLDNAGVVHPQTGEIITSYKKLARNPYTKHIWQQAFGKEIGNLAQGDSLTGTKGRDTIIFLNSRQNQQHSQ